MLPDGWPHDALPPGTILNGYCIQSILGRGGFGITYKAVDELDQRFAVKECFPRQFGYRADLEIVPNSESEADAFKDCRDRFLREARALAQLGSAGGDGVVKVVTYFRAHQTAYIVMELLDGETLEDLIKDHKGSFPKYELEGIFAKLLNVLERVHQFGLIHRDIKPNNIILKENNRPILIDFGATRASSHGQMTTFTQIFSESYAPIEQILAATQGPMSDIYAVGATFYKAIGGKTVDAFSRQQALLLNKPDPQPPATEIGAGRYEPRFLMAVDAALRVQPEERPQSATDLMKLLSDGEDDSAATRLAPAASIIPRASPDPTVSRTGSTPPSFSFQAEANNKRDAVKEVPKDRKRSALPYLIVLLAGLALVGSGVGGWLLFLHSSKPQPSENSSAATSSTTASEAASVPIPPPPAPVVEPKPTPTPPPPSPPVVQQLSAADALAKGNAAYKTKDYAEAMSWFRKAADQGNADGEANIGFLYENAQGVPRDYAEAMSWFRKAAEQGNGRAENAIGILYDRGWGVAQDYAESMRWYRKAADHGNSNAIRNIGILYKNGWGVPQDHVEALKWFRKAADQGNAEGMNSIGVSYENGLGVPRDYPQAISWYRKAADLGNAMAEINLGLLYEKGLGVPKDFAEAMRWYRKAADHGNPGGENNIGVMYARGWGVPQDYVEALRWYRLAADHGNDVGMNNIAKCYETGSGVPKDLEQARQWREKAAAGGNQDARNWLASHRR